MKAGLAIAALLLAVLLSLASGAGGAADAFALELRVPRTLAALLVGAALGAAGLLMQTATRNPLAEPGLLGVNAGAALGVVCGIVLTGAGTGPQYMLWAGAGALLGNACVMAIARGRSPLKLVLAGVALGASFYGASSALLLSQPSGYDQYRFWVLGSLAGADMATAAWSVWPVAASLLLAWLLARPLSTLLLGDDSARALGYSPALLRVGVGAVTTVLTGCAVALAGPVAFIGLLAPHLSKGRDLAARLLASIWIGAALVLLADVAARLAAQPYETPLSAVTALLGAPLLIWQARKQHA